ncbi:MAG: hypothetical protein F4Y03_02100 [Alphaproteobacteria bacterium]|nr:hypothetical protein [Alphaproteobacteria bacterium]
MTTDRGDFPEYLTFSQRHGYEPLPEPMRLEEISDGLRQEIWGLIKEVLYEKRLPLQAVTFRQPTRYGFHQKDFLFFQRILGKVTGTFDPNSSYEAIYEHLHHTIQSGPFNKVLDLLLVLINDRRGLEEIVDALEEAFERYAAAYRLDTSEKPYQFVPQASKQQGEATRQAIETVHEGGIEGAASHLRQAVDHINAHQYADAVADSIHAVVSVARAIDPKANKDLGPALISLENAGLLKHSALKRAFTALYGYTSDEEGIRKALVYSDAADVGLDEAVFMLGACASFAAYLTQKHRQASRE